jgi:hypothetical protein
VGEGMTEAEVAAALTRGPRGLRMLLEFAALSDATAHPGDSLGPLGMQLFRAFSRGENAVTYARVGRPLAHRTRKPNSPRAVQKLADPLARIPRLIDELDLIAPDEHLLRASTAEAVGAGHYWEEPDALDLVTMAPEVRRSLERVAAHVAPAIRALSWWSDAPTDTQCAVQWDDASPWSSAASGERAGAFRSWRKETASEYGPWWSTPPIESEHSTGRFSDGSPIRLWLEEDAFGRDRALVHPLLPIDERRILEIREEQDWVRLCREHPLDTTKSRRPLWGSATGRDGAWTVPDWTTVVEEYDGVHLSLGAYLDLAGRALDVDDRSASLIAGWHPDATFWLTPMPESARPPELWTARETQTSAIDVRWSRKDG